MIFEKQIVNMYKGMLYTRCDDTQTVFYFSQKDFPKLKEFYRLLVTADEIAAEKIVHQL